MMILDRNVSARGKYTLREKSEESRYSLAVIPDGEITLESVTIKIPFKFEEKDSLFLNGYQSWTYSPERGIKDYDRSLKYCPEFMDSKYGFSRYGDNHFCPPVYKKGVQRGYTYAYIRRNDSFFFIGSLNENTGFTRITFNTGENAVIIEKDCSGRVTAQEYDAIDVAFLSGDEKAVFDGYFDLLGIKPLPVPKSTGYTSWYNCYQNISESRIISDLEGLKDLPFKPDVFQIDDGFETFVGDWLDVDPAKFPDGTEKIAKMITDSGYRAGIWLAPFVCEKNSRLFKEHPEYLLRDADGNPVYCGSNWSGAYALDFYNEDVRDYISESIGKYAREGFRLFKLDFLYAACMLPRPDKTRGEIMNEAMSFLRKVCGDAYIIGCGVPLAPAFGRVEFCRIGPDVSLDFDDKAFMRLFHAERPSTKHTILNTVFRRQLSGRAFMNDPDVFILRDENTTLTEEQKLLLGKVNGLFGGLLFASDEFGKYDEKKKDLYQYFAGLKNATDIRVEKNGSLLVVEYDLDGKSERFEYDFK
ncbi:MAG: alpha-galactosidase [Clostridia bacterium]|nr:alpha-galactosidase [Clostridia bacterium]